VQLLYDGELEEQLSSAGASSSSHRCADGQRRRVDTQGGGCAAALFLCHVWGTVNKCVAPHQGDLGLGGLLEETCCAWVGEGLGPLGIEGPLKRGPWTLLCEGCCA